MNSFLMELMSEEIPSSDQKNGRYFLESYFSEKLGSFELSYSDISTFSSPRRLTILINGIGNKTETIKEEKRGPRVGCPEKALNGFLKANNLKIGDLKTKNIKDTRYYFSEKLIEGRKSSEILAVISEQLLKNFKWKKSMRWGSKRLRWVRPLKSILAIQYSEKKISKIINFQINGIKSGNQTFGHRFMSPRPFVVSNFDSYIKDLRNNFVELDHNERINKVSQQLVLLTKNEDFDVVEDMDLIEEVNGLVEWPVALMGEIEQSFLDLPPEILQTVMKTHQKYFSVINNKTKKIVKYITIANIIAKDGGRKILKGNNRVLNSRLSDAKFFWEIDKERIAQYGFESYKNDLEAVTFFRGLGSQFNRADRIKEIGKNINNILYKLPEEEIILAANVCKADLVSSTVKEFPELQGLLGSYFSAMSGFSDSVGLACKEHYAPVGPSDKVPTSPLSITISLADKIDLLTSFWSINEKPTGSKDPFGLRRAAIGVIRLTIENGINIKLKKLFQFSQQNFDLEDIANFLSDRLRIHLKDIGNKGTTFDACINDGCDWSTYSLAGRVKAIDDFLNTKDGQKLLQLSRRALNILLAEEKKDGVEYSLAPERLDGLAQEELELIEVLESTDKKILDLLKKENYSDVLMMLASLYPKVAYFFEEFQINSDNSILRRNRLCILGLIRSMLNRIADFRILE